MNEKSDFEQHYDIYQQVLKELRRKFAIPWQQIIKQAPNTDYERLHTWFPEHCARAAIQRAEQRLVAERAGKILFNLFSEEDKEETDLAVIEGRKQVKKLLNITE